MKPVKIEIYNKKTKEVLEIKEFDTPRGVEAFKVYFAMQCNTAMYGWRQKEAGK